MNRAEELIIILRANGGKVTLGQLIDRRDGLSLKYTEAISEARIILASSGQTIVWHKKTPTIDTIYAIEPIEIPAFTDKETGQREMSDLWEL